MIIQRKLKISQWRLIFDEKILLISYEVNLTTLASLLSKIWSRESTGKILCKVFFTWNNSLEGKILESNVLKRNELWKLSQRVDYSTKHSNTFSIISLTSFPVNIHLFINSTIWKEDTLKKGVKCLMTSLWCLYYYEYVSHHFPKFLFLTLDR